MTHLKQLIQFALEEDLKNGDITTEALVDSSRSGEGILRAKQDLVVAGGEVAKQVFAALDPKIEWDSKAFDGKVIQDGETIAICQAPLSILLKGERTALNFLQRLSGIATLTRQFVQKVEGTRVKILDTRKTTPGWRELEKYAVRMGGGHNHRLGLFDRYLIKNNHIAIAGSLSKAVEKIIQNRKKDFLVEVEVRTLKELQEALPFPIDIVMLDNFKLEDISKTVNQARGKVKLEVSGNVSLENVRAYAETGVDFISIGALTHSAPAADIHMVIEIGSSPK